MTETLHNEQIQIYPSAVERPTSQEDWVGLELGCETCVLPEGYKGAEFIGGCDSLGQCGFCTNHEERTFLGGERLVADLNLEPGEKVGVTVSGGKDGLATWLWLADNLGGDRVVAFNHEKLGGIVHPLATQNLNRASEALNSKLVRVSDDTMLPRIQRNIEALFDNPDPAMVRVALCAGCRVGISSDLFEAGRQQNIHKFVNAASYLELAPFKGGLMREKGYGIERLGLLRGLVENPGYDHDDNLLVIDRDDSHNQKAQLAGGKSSAQYPDIQFLDFDTYFPNIPAQNEALVRDRLGWSRPDRSWHFDCQLETLKDVFYYGTLGYTETDGHLSAMVRHGLMDRETAMAQLLKARWEIIEGKGMVLDVMNKLGMGHLEGRMDEFYANSPFLNVIR